MPLPRLIDSHCHLYFARYDGDRDAVLQRARHAGVSHIIVPAIDLASCRAALDLARKHANISAAIGVHPNSCADFKARDIALLRSLAERNSALAIGEIGLDYYRDKCPQTAQRRAFEAQLELAAQLQLPVIIHNRDADADVMAILEDWAPSAPLSLRGRLGVLHSFSASAEVAARAIELGFYLGFTGPITFKKADELRAIAAGLPLDRLLIETDGPFLTPQPHRGARNEPAFVGHINDKLAELHNISGPDMARRSTCNAARLFALA